MLLSDSETKARNLEKTLRPVQACAHARDSDCVCHRGRSADRGAAERRWSESCVVRAARDLLRLNAGELDKSASMEKPPYKLSSVLHGHSADVRAVATFLDGTVVSVSRDKTARVWKPTGLVVHGDSPTGTRGAQNSSACSRIIFNTF